MPGSSSSSSSSPLPPPAPAATTARRRHRLLSSAASLSFPSSPSPFHHRLHSPLRASSVPFSWEHRPGIPKTPARARASSKSGKPAPLPLPPSLRSRDVYASVAPAEYAAMPDSDGTRRRQRRRWWRRRPALADALAEWLAVLSLYRSCKDAAAGCFVGPRPGRCAPAKAA